MLLIRLATEVLLLLLTAVADVVPPLITAEPPVSFCSHLLIFAVASVEVVRLTFIVSLLVSDVEAAISPFVMTVEGAFSGVEVELVIIAVVIVAVVIVA
eukprot:1975084-Prorocentrum_lima.AAC.1